MKGRMPVKRLTALFLACILGLSALPALAEDIRIDPAFPVPDYVTWLLEIAAGEVGYEEGPHGYSKYGEWSGDPYAQWCAEFLCWCVDQVDQRHGTELLKNVYPLYSGSNSGRSWFIRSGRYIVRNGNLENWGYQWLKGEDHFLTTGDYIPQPGDWVFFTWTSDTNTDHVAMVEYCTRDSHGNVTIHVIEGNNPDAVSRGTYDLTYSRILGYGTVHDAADWTMRRGCSGEKVRLLQEDLIYLGYLPEDGADGRYGSATQQGVEAIQRLSGLTVNGIANLATQQALAEAVAQAIDNDPNTWLVVDDEDDLW